jgi:phosphocarrier protein FPr/phosphocarrier protein
MSGALSVTLLAPCDGWVAALAEVPDPVFAERMMGDGLAIDPLDGVLHAPCDGEILVLHRACHAVTLRAGNGAEILLHIGLDTVALAGDGFTAHVREGQLVTAGDALISFDLDRVAHAAKSLMTPMVVTNGDDFTLECRPLDRRVAKGDALLVVHARPRPASIGEQESPSELRRALVVPMAHGLHARPAARIAALAKTFAADIALWAGDRRANAKSPVALMGLGLGRGAAATLIAGGSDAEQAIDALCRLIETGIGESTATEQADSQPPPASTTERGVLTGVTAVPGLALGFAVHLRPAEIIPVRSGQGVELERAKLGAALAAVATRLKTAQSSDSAAAILAAHLGFLEDPELLAAAQSVIAAGDSAGFAWRHAVAMQSDVLRGLDDPRLRERVNDLTDIEQQVQRALCGALAERLPALPEDAILLADDLLPSHLLGLDPGRLSGIATCRGGPTSHVAILAASMNIPALVACGDALLAIAEGDRLLLDADAGRLSVDPAAPELDRACREITGRRDRAARARRMAQELCRTRDGERIEIAANLGAVTDAEAAVAAGAEGCGLLRTEFLFLDRQQPPDEAEQTETYRAIARSLAGRPLIIRTLDIGGDKPASYLAIPPEENPALGLRGIRVSLWRPDLLTVQLRAILKGVPAAQCRIMLPMVANLAELRSVRQMLDRLRHELGVTDKIALGVMVETPAAAITADLLAAEADFLSIGTNDLTQYCLAMDRGNSALAASIDAWHPAVLRLIAITVQGALRHGRWTGLCGGLASDPAAAALLIGLGVRELSVSIGRIAEIKAAVGCLTLERCRALATRALAAGSAAEIRAMAAEAGEN